MILQNDDRAVEIVDASALAPNVLFQCIKYVVEMIVRESPDITELKKKKKRTNTIFDVEDDIA